MAGHLTAAPRSPTKATRSSPSASTALRRVTLRNCSRLRAAPPRSVCSATPTAAKAMFGPKPLRRAACLLLSSVRSSLRHLTTAAVEVLVLDEDDRVVVRIAALSRPFASARGRDAVEQAGHVEEHRLARVRVRRAELVTGALGHAHDERHGHLAAEHASGCRRSPLMIWSIARSEKLIVMSSTTGRRPVIAAPMPMPTIVFSEIGVSRTRFSPNSASSPWPSP